MTTETTTAISRRGRPRGRYPKTQDGAVPKRQKRIPEYLEADEVNAIIRAAPSPKAKLLTLQQRRASWKSMKQYEICLPPHKLSGAFENIMQPKLRRIWDNSLESRTLAALRDAMLPELVSGTLEEESQRHKSFRSGRCDTQ